METNYPVGAIACSVNGLQKNDLVFYQVTERKGNKILLSRLESRVTLKGNIVPGKPDPNAKPFRRTINQVYGGEILAPVVLGHYVAGIRPWGLPKALMPRGGRRVGSGRKKGSGTGRTVVSKSVTLTNEEWQQIEEMKGSAGVSEFFRARIFGQKKISEKNP